MRRMIKLVYDKWFIEPGTSRYLFLALVKIDLELRMLEWITIICQIPI